MPFPLDSGQIGLPIWLARGYPARAASRREKTSNFRFHVPIWKVRGRTILDMGNDETTVVFCVSKQEVHNAAAAVRRRDARRSLVGLQVQLAMCPWSASGLLPRRHGVSADSADL